MKKCLLLLLLILFPHYTIAQTISFSGYKWQVRTDTGGPGPNHWSSSAVRIDNKGRLHLTLQQVNGVWQCAEIYTLQNLGFGTYRFEVEGPLDSLDKNVVLGLFNYTLPSIGPDGTNEIDIELAHWGVQSYPNLNLTVWPAVPHVKEGHKEYNFQLPDKRAWFCFHWTAHQVSYSATAIGKSAPFGVWKFAPQNYTQSIPQNPLPVHINLWLFRGMAPSNSKSVHIIIRKFQFEPAAETPAQTDSH